MIENAYEQIMEIHPPHLVLKLDTTQPIELGDFVGAFTSLANEYERYALARFPGRREEARIYVREVRVGCIEADLVPYLMLAMPFIDTADKIQTIEDFVRRWGARFLALRKNTPANSGPSSEHSETRNELKDWANATAAIAHDPNGSATLSAAHFEDGKRKITASFTFETKDARAVQEVIEDRRRLLDAPSSKVHSRVLMVFTRSDINDAEVGKKSGERVKIEDVSPKSLALMYGSELAEAAIKHEIRDADENVFKRGFVVDVQVKESNGSPVAYSVTHLHQVIDLG